MKKDGPVAVEIDLAHGGRWTSLRQGGREWLWRREMPERHLAQPGSPFVDAGGLEECIPTIRGQPDHGQAWSRRWTGDEQRATVTTPEFTLMRQVSTTANQVVGEYRLDAEPDYRFLWAAHALLALSAQATLECQPGTPVRVFAPAESWEYHKWPDAGGLDLNRLGPDDGTAVSAIVEASWMLVREGSRQLRFTVAAGDQPTAIGVWRNLRGWPEGDPYRSIGVEPMLGRVWDRAAGTAADLAATSAEGQAEWRLSVRLESPHSRSGTA